jgi:hypothetical protein
MTDWRKRKHGTPEQVGKPFPVDGESQQHKKSALSKLVGNLSGGDRSARTKKFVEGLKQVLRSKEDKLMTESEILTPNDVKLLCDRGLLEINDDDEIKITAKGLAFLQKQRQKERPNEFTKNGQVKLTEQNKRWFGEDEEDES